MEFEDLTEFYYNPPGLKELVFEARDQRKGKHDTLIIVPSYHDSFRLKKLLKYLKNQTFKGFDVAVIFAKDDKFVSEPAFSLYQVKRKADFGFAGAVYLGQLLALRDKYKYYLFTDVDRVPHSRNILGTLHSTAEEKGADFVYGNNMVKGYFFPHGGFFEYRNPQTVKSNCVFGLIRASTLARTGLYALPLYIGYEDVEFEYRLRKAMRSEAYLDRTVYESYSSPAKNSFLKNFGGNGMGVMYIYPTMVCMFHSPQTSNHLGLMRKLRMFFVMLLAQKFSALRIPELSRLEDNARKGRFARTYGNGVSGHISVRDCKEELERDYGSYTANAPASNMSRILSSLLFPKKGYKTSNYSPLFDFFIHDSFYVYDEGRKSARLFEWKRKPPVNERILAFFAALWGAVGATAMSSCYELIGNRGVFDRYGLARAEEGGKTREQR